MKHQHLILAMLLTIPCHSIHAQLPITTETESVVSSPFDNPSKELTTVAPSGLLSREQALFDISALLYTLSEVHPNMYANTGQEKLLKTFSNITAQVPDSISNVDLYRLITPWISMIGDGHTRIGFPYNSYFTQNLKRFPLKVNVGEDYSMTATASLDNIIPVGAKILTINGVKVKDMIEHMMQYTFGEREFYKIMQINQEFALYIHLLYISDQYKVEYTEQGQKTVKTVTLPAISFDEARTRILPHPQKNTQTTTSAESYSFRILNDSQVAIMNFKQCWDADKMKVFADSMFTTLKAKGIKNLIIDIRENGGGDSRVGDELLRFIAPTPFQQFGQTMVRITPTSSKMIKGNFKTPNIYWYGNNTLEPTYYGTDKFFDGKVYLLISHRTFSSASSFAWAFKQFKCGTIIGEETGGMSVSFGDILIYTLPISKLQCSISYKRFWLYGSDEKDIHGTIPDIITPKATTYDEALKIISKGKTKR